MNHQLENMSCNKKLCTIKIVAYVESASKLVPFGLQMEPSVNLTTTVNEISQVAIEFLEVRNLEVQALLSKKTEARPVHVATCKVF